MEERNELWSGWRTVRRLGAGSFGAVYEIERDVFGEVEKAALKEIVLPREEGDTEELRSLGYDDESITLHYKSCLEDIVREYTLMRKLKGHSNIVDCDDLRYEPHESGFGWRIRIKMELLTPMLKALDVLKHEGEILRLGMDLCQALIACRKRNIIHRDIKPQNIFRSEDGNYKLGDFGIAKTSEKTSGGTKTGTYNYMAPEVYNNQPYGAAADICSLGLVLYWLLNEYRSPFQPLPPQVLTPTLDEQARLRRFGGEPLPPPANGSEALKQVVLRACAFDQAVRYATPEEFYAALSAVKNGTPAQPSAPAWNPNDQEGTVGVWQGRAPRQAASQEGTVGVFAPRTPTPQAVQTPVRHAVPTQPPVQPRPVVQQIPVQPRPVAVQQPPQPKKKKVWPWIVAALLIFAAIGAAVTWLGDKKNSERRGTSMDTSPSQSKTTEAPVTASNVRVTFDGNYYVDGDAVPWGDVYYWTEAAEGGVNAYFQPTLDVDYLMQAYGTWEIYVYITDSNGQIFADTYYSYENGAQVNEALYVLVEEGDPVGEYIWSVEIYAYGTDTVLSAADMAFTVEHSN